MNDITKISRIVRLDLTDRKILYQLDLDARTPVSIIARKLRLSRIVVDYRIKKMLQSGLIRHFSSFTDPSKFGLSSWKVYLRFHNIHPGAEEEIINYLRQHTSVWWVVKCYGRYDVLYSAFAESFYEFNKVIEAVHARFGQYILEEAINNHLEPQYFSRGYLVKHKPAIICPPFMKKPVKEKIDEIDMKLLKELGNNCRLSLMQLAHNTGITPRIAAYRIRDLLKRRIIAFNRLSLDVNRIGMDFYKALLYLKNISEEEYNKIATFCRYHPYINECVKSVGEWQMEVEMEVKEFKHFNEIVEEMRLQFPHLIVRVEPLLLYKEYKTEFNFLNYYKVIR